MLKSIAKKTWLRNLLIISDIRKHNFISFDIPIIEQEWPNTKIKHHTCQKKFFWVANFFFFLIGVLNLHLIAKSTYFGHFCPQNFENPWAKMSFSRGEKRRKKSKVRKRGQKWKFSTPMRKKKVRYSKELFLTSMILYFGIRPTI